MTEQEKLIKHIDDLIDTFRFLYRDYRCSKVLAEYERKRLCQALMGCAFGLAQDFNELERMKTYDERPKYNENQ